MVKEIMKPSNKRWEEFTRRLEGPEGCDFKLKDKNDPMSFTFKCSGGSERPFATAILEKMGNIDIPETMKYFDKHGGYCDCEILLNVER